MSYQDIIAKTRPEFEKMLEFFSKELAKVRTGQASPALVEDIPVDVFGQIMPLKKIAAISSPERRQIVIQPWDKSYLAPIEKALSKGSLGTFPVVDQDIIRVTLPQLTQEYRQTLLKHLAVIAEQTRESMRKQRDDAWSAIQQETKDGAIREDDKFLGKKELQKLIDEYNKKIDELIEKKTKEISGSD